MDGLRSRFLADKVGLEMLVGAVVTFQNFYSDSVSPKKLWDQDSFLTFAPETAAVGATLLALLAFSVIPEGTDLFLRP